MSDPVKVVIDTPGPTITVEAHGGVDTIIGKALALYRDVVKDWPRPADPDQREMADQLKNHLLELGYEIEELS
jgi:hypothetical protein